MVVIMKISVFYDATPYSLLQAYQHFRETWHHIAEDNKLYHLVHSYIIHETVGAIA